MIYFQIISIIGIILVGAVIIREDLRLVWNDLLDWSIDTIETCFEVKGSLWNGESFPRWLNFKGHVAMFMLDLDALYLRSCRYWTTVRAYYKYHQKAQAVYGGKRIRYQLWFRTWITVPRFVYEFYCWQRVRRSTRYAMRLQRERRWE